MKKIDVIVESDGYKICAYLPFENKHLGFYGEGFSDEEAIEDFMLSYEDYKTEEISEGKDPEEYNFNFIFNKYE